MDTAQWPQEIVVKPIEEIVTNTCPKPPPPSVNAPSSALERKSRPQKEQALNCPRCNSTNTKFCYYNNYSLTQPRYFCKTCRRYWTEGGSLRNIPVGGGSRKNKRSSSSSSSLTNSFSNSLASKKLPDLVTPPISLSASSQNPNSKIHEGQDLNLAFPSTQGIRSFSELIQVPNNSENGTKNPNSVSALELLTGISSRGLNTFLPMPIQDPNSVYSTSTSSGFNPLQDFKPSLNFSLDGLGNGYGGATLHQETTGGRLLFPFEDLKQAVQSTNNHHDPVPIHEQSREQGHHDSSGYWSGMLGGGNGGSW